MTVESANRRFQDWTRVGDGNGRTGTIIWNPTDHEYNVLWDDNGWEPYQSNTKELREL